MHIEEKINKLKKIRRQHLKTRSVFSIARSLGKLSSEWLKKDNFYRLRAISRLVQRSKLTPRMATEMLDSVFKELTEDKLLLLLKSELGSAVALDGFVKDAVTKRMKKASGPEVTLHIFSSSSPQSTLFSFITGLLLKSVNILKPSGEDRGFLDIYFESLKAADSNLALTNLVLEPSARGDLKKLFGIADAVVAYGQDSTLEKIRKKLPVKTRYLAYGHCVSVSLFLKECLTEKKCPLLAKRAARDVWMMDQRGCLSSLILFAQKGGRVAPKEFASQIASQLEILAQSDKQASNRDRMIRHARLKSFYQIKKIKGELVFLWQSRDLERYSVYYDEKMDTEILKHKAEQILFVKAFSDTAQVLDFLSPLKRSLQGAALEAPRAAQLKIADELSLVGISRICRAGSLQTPPVSWHHDGKPSLLPLIFWTDLE